MHNSNYSEGQKRLGVALGESVTMVGTVSAKTGQSEADRKDFPQCYCNMGEKSEVNSAKTKCQRTFECWSDRKSRGHLILLISFTK